MTGTTSSYSIQNLPEIDRPRERLARHGAEALSAVELIAILLGSGTKTAPVMHLSQDLISKFGSLQSLAEATIEELCQVKGIGPAKAIQLRAAFSLALRINKENLGARYKIEHPIHAYHLIRDALAKEKRELFVIIMLDAKGYVITQHTVAIGTLTESVVHPREVFYPAIRHKAVSVILAHNHPSGDLTPSKDDLNITKDLIATGRLVGIPINDHIIVSERGFLSMRQRGDVFFDNSL